MSQRRQRPERILLSPGEVGLMLGKRPIHVRQLVQDGKLRAFREPSGRLKIPRGEVQKYVENAVQDGAP